MQFTYLLIHLGTILFPLILSFENKIQFRRKWKYVFLSISAVSPWYLVWDSIATLRGDWGFSYQYTVLPRIAGLPIEEILFFVSVPFSCLFIYETAKLYIPEKRYVVSPYLYIAVGVIFLLGAFLFRGQYYTATVMLFCVAAAATDYFTGVRLFQSRVFLVTLLFTYIPFFVVNYILTSLPVVWYSNTAIWGVRVTTIPAEDFFYSFSMITLWFVMYERYRMRDERKQTDRTRGKEGQVFL